MGTNDPTKGAFGRWAWELLDEKGRNSFQVPAGFPEYAIYEWSEDDPVLAYCDSWYEAEMVARALHAADLYMERS